MSTSDQDERLQAELSLLQSMYPEIRWSEKARELSYTAPEGGNFTLRLPSDYLNDELPEVLSATAGKRDMRDALKQLIRAQTVGEEILDAIIQAFEESLEKISDAVPPSFQAAYPDNGSADQAKKATIAVWLHHLLNTNKRKQALSPGAGVSGVTKPGYPGVLIYSGPAHAVHEHVNELKQLNWAAFQVRLEEGEEWKFAHGEGVIEVESMGEAVKEVGERKQEFMEAMKIK